MSASQDHLPLGIRNNNPGNLRAAVGPDFKTKLVNGFAHFDTMENGTRSLFYLIHGYYFTHGLRVLPDFVARYAPATENDVAAYIRNIGQRIYANPLKIRTQDLHLDRPWAALQFARAIIAVENGQSPPTIAAHPEWVGPFTMIDAMRNTGKWATL
jgi:hypothetical protein